MAAKLRRNSPKRQAAGCRLKMKTCNSYINMYRQFSQGIKFRILITFWVLFYKGKIGKGLIMRFQFQEH